MPAMACVDASAVFNFFHSWEGSSLPAPEPFSGGTPTCHHLSTPWSTNLSSSLYNLSGWGAPYFYINSFGNISVRPRGTSTLPHEEIDLMKVVQKSTSAKPSGGLGLQSPLVIRFPEILQHRLESLNKSFEFATKTTGYGSHYQGVYPVKCNQDRHIVEDLVHFGSPYKFGLEAGSKPELLLAMSCLLKGSPDAFLICNGYKDSEYVSLALMARTMQLNTVIVLEQEEELDTIIQASQKLNIKPCIGIRAKLRTKHSGHFGSTSGEKGKFGLTTSQILSIISKLKTLNMLDSLQLLHFHIGSQIPSTALLADGVNEAAQIYCELTRLGANMKVIDVGGGLGVDYDGSHSSGSDLSVGYGLDEYASTVVQSIKFACDQKGVKHPVLCSESGRALVSHHSVLIFEAFSTTRPNNIELGLGQNMVYYLDNLTDDLRADYRNLMATAMRGDYDMCHVYIDQLKKRSAEQFKEGNLGLEHLAAIDALSDLVCREIGDVKQIHAYHINLSLFTSIPDFWAIGQLFPILPIHRLNEKPSIEGTLLDLTCDSDGKINKFINGQSTLPLHEINHNNNNGGYYLGMFLGGAYQEALGGLHNLFGGPSIVRVMQHEGPHGFLVTSTMSGPSCADVLRAMQHEPELMFDSLKHKIEECRLGPSWTGFMENAFGSMPYLVFGNTDNGDNNGGGDNLGFTSDSEGSSGVMDEGSVGFLEEEEWEIMRGLGM